MSEGTFSAADFLGRKKSEIHRPPVWPLGTWHLRIVGKGTIRARDKGGENAPIAEVSIPVQPVAPYDDVSRDEVEYIEANGGLKAVKGFHRIPLFTSADDYRINAFLDAIGFEDKDHFGPGSDPTTGERLEKVKGYEFRASVRYRPNKDNPEEPFVDFVSVANVNEPQAVVG